MNSDRTEASALQRPGGEGWGLLLIDFLTGGETLKEWKRNGSSTFPGTAQKGGMQAEPSKRLDLKKHS